MFLLLLLLVDVLPVSTEGGEIIWGTEAKLHSHPYMAFIRYYDKKSKPKRCGGFLVEKDIVMTAAHCDGRNISITLGAHNIKEQNNTQFIPVHKSIPHESYSSAKMVNDIMLLKTIALPKRHNWVKPGQVCTLEVQESQTCQKLYKSYNNSTQLCVGNPKDKKATAGRFGGPFVCQGMAQGIVSQHHCTGDLPEVFTRISSFIPWIQKK
ncbi:Mcpt8l2 [Phodopus roborovskii]|uniref:Mcpt8l2 protein n=1 Tax=Phodopus roborovskii TaxID=109678 RepID=A0AAU9ZPR8_PHORO|nr:Mcpt8l2 [Phodopus roborovskii]